MSGRCDGRKRSRWPEALRDHVAAGDGFASDAPKAIRCSWSSCCGNAEETTAAHLPGSIQSLVLARVDNLEPLDRRALQAASIIGQQFSLEVLRHLLQAPGYTCAGLVED